MNVTYKFVLKARKNSDNSNSVLFRIICNRTSIYISTGIRINLQYWDQRNGKIKTSHPLNFQINSQLQVFVEKLNSFLALSSVNKTSITEQAIKECFVQKPSTTHDFFEFAKIQIETNGVKTLSAKTLKDHRFYLKQLREYCSSLTFEQITIEFLTGYEYYLKTKRGNDTNTIHGKLKFIRTYVNKALKAGLIEFYVFRNYKLKTKKSKPRYLDRTEFDKLVLFYNTTNSCLLKRHLQYFLFACSTGLRYGDMQQLRWEDINQNCITITQSKTQEPVTIPLNGNIRKYLPERKQSGLVFRVPTNQKANYYLKQIQKAAGISKTLTTHVARHTFATTGLNLSMPLPVVSRLLGHKSIKSTEIYARVVDRTLYDEMKKWDSL